MTFALQRRRLRPREVRGPKSMLLHLPFWPQSSPNLRPPGSGPRGPKTPGNALSARNPDEINPGSLPHINHVILELSLDTASCVCPAVCCPRIRKLQTSVQSSLRGLNSLRYISTNLCCCLGADQIRQPGPLCGPRMPVRERQPFAYL